MHSIRRCIIAAILVLGGIATSVRAQDYPTRPVRFISDSAPGSAIDVTMRVIAGAVEAKNAIPLAVAAPRRMTMFPDLATVAETLPGFQSAGWQMLVAPVGTPDAIVKKVNADLIKALALDDVKKRLTALGRDDLPLSPAETLAFIQHEQATWAPILAQIGPVK